MTEFILFFIGYFFSTLILSKIAEKEEIELDWLAWFLLLLPPLYFLYITKRFQLMIFLTIFTYMVINLLIVNWFNFFLSISLFLVPFLVWCFYIIYNLKTDKHLLFLIFFPPVLWVFILFIYLAFIYIPIEDIEKEKNIKAQIAIKKKKKSLLKSRAKKTFSGFESLNKDLFKEFDKINYQKINNENHLWLN